MRKKTRPKQLGPFGAALAEVKQENGWAPIGKLPLDVFRATALAVSLESLPTDVYRRLLRAALGTGVAVPARWAPAWAVDVVEALMTSVDIIGDYDDILDLLRRLRTDKDLRALAIGTMQRDPKLFARLAWRGAYTDAAGDDA